MVVVGLVLCLVVFVYRRRRRDPSTSQPPSGQQLSGNHGSGDGGIYENPRHELSDRPAQPLPRTQGNPPVLPGQRNVTHIAVRQGLNQPHVSSLPDIAHNSRGLYNVNDDSSSISTQTTQDNPLWAYQNKDHNGLV